MKKRSVLCSLLVICLVFFSACEIVKSPDYYELNGGDNVPSYTKVVGSRTVSTKKINMTNAVQSVVYSYKDVEDAYADAETYIDYLMDEEGFYFSGMLNMDEEEDEITISKTSPNDKEYEIRIIVTYSTKTQTVKINAEREKIIG